MKVLIVAHDADFTGGANRSLFTNIKVFQKKYHVDLLVLLPSGKGALNQKLDEIGVPWIRARYCGLFNRLQHDGKDLLRRIKHFLSYNNEKFQGWRTAKKLKDERIDVVYTNTRLPMIGAEIARILNVPHVMHVRELGPPEPLQGRWDFQAIYDSSDRIILISRALEKQFAEHVPEDKLVVSLNGLEYEGVDFSYDGLEKDTLHLIVTGRLVPDKNQEEAIRAIDHIRKNRLLERKLVLHIAGSSPKRKHVSWYARRLKSLVESLGLQDAVIFEGEIADMHEIRRHMDIELMCAVQETFGRVTVEAMRSGLMMIGSNTGGTTEIIQDGVTGYLYNQGDYRDLAEKIVHSVSDIDRYNEIRKNAIAYASTHFTVEQNCEEIYHVLASCMEEETVR